VRVPPDEGRTPVTPGPATQGGLELWSGPEGELLARKRAELEVVQAELAARELVLGGFQAELAAFETQYRCALGARYARLDDLTERLEAGRDAGAPPPAAEKTEKAEEAGPDGTDGGDDGQNWAWARGEREAPTDADRRPTVSETAKRLFRRLARSIHPDLAADPRERERRTNLMVEANHAYEKGDLAALRRLLQGWERSPDAVVGTTTRAELERTMRRIDRARERLAEIDAELAALEASAMGWLRRRVQKAAGEGWDLLAHMARELDRQILEAEEELARLPFQGVSV
jgi:hypothetical protein